MGAILQRQRRPAPSSAGRPRFDRKFHLDPLHLRKRRRAGERPLHLRTFTRRSLSNGAGRRHGRRGTPELNENNSPKLARRPAAVRPAERDWAGMDDTVYQIRVTTVSQVDTDEPPAVGRGVRRPEAPARAFRSRRRFRKAGREVVSDRGSSRSARRRAPRRTSDRRVSGGRVCFRGGSLRPCLLRPRSRPRAGMPSVHKSPSEEARDRKQGECVTRPEAGRTVGKNEP